MPKTASQITAPRIRQLAALPWRREADGSLLILLVTSRTNQKWMLPKGWAIDGKTDSEAAELEAREEAGVTGDTAPRPIGSYLYLKLFDDGSTKPSQALVFSMKVTRQFRKWPERHQRGRKWVSAADAAQMVHEKDLARFFSSLAGGRIVL